jgi:EamA domain-containing membrane protein RarD
MKETRLIIPELGLIAGTRAALGGGVALLLADKLTKEQRKAVGWTLFLVGAITTIPLVILAFAAPLTRYREIAARISFKSVN